MADLLHLGSKYCSLSEKAMSPGHIMGCDFVCVYAGFACRKYCCDRFIACLTTCRVCFETSSCKKKKTKHVQSTLVISKLKEPSETLRDIRTSTYQIFRTEENFTNEYVIRLLSLEIYIENIVGKGRNCSSGAISPLIHNILLPDVKFLCLNKDQIFSSG